MSEQDDQDLQDDVNNAVAGSDADQTADNDQDDAGVGDDLENDGTEESDEDADQGDSDAAGDSSGDADDTDEEDEDEADNLAVMRPELFGADATVEPFDIRKLPRDENGLIDPETANKAVQEHLAKVTEAANKNANVTGQVRTALTGQWNKGSEKFPHIWKNRDLREMALNIHLSSFEKAKSGTGQYVSPITALKKVDKMYKRAFKGGVAATKTRKRIVSTGASERAGTGAARTQTTSEYADLKKQAASKDPTVAREGRQKLLIYRRNARRALGTPS